MTDQKSTGPVVRARNDYALEGLGFGIFAVVAGALMFSEQMGWLSADVKWFIPLVLIALGLAALARVWVRRRN